MFRIRGRDYSLDRTVVTTTLDVTHIHYVVGKILTDASNCKIDS